MPQAPNTPRPDQDLAPSEPVGHESPPAGTTFAAGTDGFGPDATSILATEHWSLLGTRSLLWNEAANRTTIFLTTLSASIVALALLADASGLTGAATAFALVLLPLVLLLGVATYVRLIQVNTDEKSCVLAMNRIRNAYLRIEPSLEPYFTASPYDDESGFARTYSLAEPTGDRPRAYLLVTSPTVVATIDATLAAATAAIALNALSAPVIVVASVGSLILVASWGALMAMQRLTMHPLRKVSPRFPTPESGSEPAAPDHEPT